MTHAAHTASPPTPPVAPQTPKPPPPRKAWAPPTLRPLIQLEHIAHQISIGHDGSTNPGNDAS